MRPEIYIHLKSRAVLPAGQEITVADVASILVAGDAGVSQGRLESMVMGGGGERVGQRRLVPLLAVVRRLKEAVPAAVIESVGANACVVTVEAGDGDTMTRFRGYILGSLVFLLLLLGSAMAIMNFHADVAMAKVHAEIYYLLTGQHKINPLIMEVPYSIGVGLGILLFFKRTGREAEIGEPSPLEIEMFLYDRNVAQFQIQEELHEQEAVLVQQQPAKGEDDS